MLRRPSSRPDGILCGEQRLRLDRVYLREAWSGSAPKPMLDAAGITGPVEAAWFRLPLLGEYYLCHQLW